MVTPQVPKPVPEPLQVCEPVPLAMVHALAMLGWQTQSGAVHAVGVE